MPVSKEELLKDDDLPPGYAGRNGQTSAEAAPETAPDTSDHDQMWRPTRRRRSRRAKASRQAAVRPRPRRTPPTPKAGSRFRRRSRRRREASRPRSRAPDREAADARAAAALATGAGRRDIRDPIPQEQNVAMIDTYTQALNLVPDGRRTIEPRRARVRHLLAPAARTGDLPQRPGRRRHVGADLRPAALSGIRIPEEADRHVHQLARRRGVLRPRDLRHHAIHPLPGGDDLHGHGGLDGLVPADGRRARPARRPAERPDHAAPALGRIFRQGVGHRAARRGHPQDQAPAERTLRQALRPHLSRRSNAPSTATTSWMRKKPRPGASSTTSTKAAPPPRPAEAAQTGWRRKAHQGSWPPPASTRCDPGVSGGWNRPLVSEHLHAGCLLGRGRRSIFHGRRPRVSSDRPAPRQGRHRRVAEHGRLSRVGPSRRPRQFRARRMGLQVADRASSGIEMPGGCRSAYRPPGRARTARR